MHSLKRISASYLCDGRGKFCTTNCFKIKLHHLKSFFFPLVLVSWKPSMRAKMQGSKNINLSIDDSVQTALDRLLFFSLSFKGKVFNNFYKAFFEHGWHRLLNIYLKIWAKRDKRIKHILWIQGIVWWGEVCSEKSFCLTNLNEQSTAG